MVGYASMTVYLNVTYSDPVIIVCFLSVICDRLKTLQHLFSAPVHIWCYTDTFAIIIVIFIIVMIYSREELLYIYVPFSCLGSSVTPRAYGTPFLHLQCLIHNSCRPLVPNFPGVWSASPWARAALANPHDRPEGIMMLHAEFGPDSLITVTVRKEQRNRYFWFYVYKMDISVVIGKIFIHMHVRFPLPSNRHHLSSDACLEDKSEDNQNCSVLCCVQQLCTLIRTHVWSSYIFAC